MIEIFKNTNMTEKEFLKKYDRYDGLVYDPNAYYQMTEKTEQIKKKMSQLNFYCDRVGGHITLSFIQKVENRFFKIEFVYNYDTDEEIKNFISYVHVTEMSRVTIQKFVYKEVVHNTRAHKIGLVANDREYRDIRGILEDNNVSFWEID